MAKVTWLGEGDNGPKETTWAHISFEKNKAIEVKDEAILVRASYNRFFKVEGFTPSTKHAEPLTHKPPSEQPVEGPVPKAGDPIVREELQMGSTGARIPETEAEGHHPAARAAVRSAPNRGR